MTTSLAAVAAFLVETLPGGALEFAWTFLAMLLASGLATSVVTSRADRRRHLAAAARNDADRAFDALAALRSAYRRRAERGPDALDGQRLADLRDALDTAARRVSRAVAARTAAYLEAGDHHASGHPEGGARAEEAAYDALVETLVSARNAFR